MYPDDLRYARDHEWARPSSDRVTVGITDYAQEQLSDVVYVDLPPLGAAVTGGQPFGEIESTKSVSDLYSPVSGTIVARNDVPDKSPELINSDPYGAGWLIVVQMRDASELGQLMDAKVYAEMVGRA